MTFTWPHYLDLAECLLQELAGLDSSSAKQRSE